MINFRCATKPEEREFTAEHGIRWRVRVAPISPTLWIELSLAAERSIIAAAARALVEVLEAKHADGEVGVNGKPATDKAVLPLVIASFPQLVDQVLDAALELGKVVQEERGN